MRPRGDFFQDLVGVDEKEFQARPELVASAFTYPETLRHLQSGQTYKCGHFRPLTVRELRAQCPQTGPGGGTFSASRGDVGGLQAGPAWREAVFQVASNFNALELCGPNDQTQMENLRFYVMDRTQGPFASISAAPGLIARHYYVFYDPERAPLEWRQQFNGRQVELLAATGLPVRNGYIVLDDESAGRSLDPADVAVGYHRGVQVTFGAVQGERHQVVEDPTQIVDQVLTATLDCMGTNRAYRPEALTRALLHAAYEGTIRAAWAGGRRKVVLTLIGGGVFANPADWIEDAILAQKDLIVESGLDVTLNLYRQTLSPKLEALVQQTGGSYPH